MFKKRFVTDPIECRTLWNALIPSRKVTDLWDFRHCFQSHYPSEPCFLLLEDRKGIVGMAPLSYSRELEMFVFFPGETWQGRTWLERTPLFLRERRYLKELLFSCPEGTYLRYMEFPQAYPGLDIVIDETGYVLYPPAIHFDRDLFTKRFSSKKYKGILKTIQCITGENYILHVNRIEDFDLLLNMNLRRFEEYSYLADSRFRESFRDVMHYLHHRGLLRMVSLEIGGEIRAVDLGAIYKGVYTVFLGGTDPEIPGVAKVMNMHHIAYACSERMQKVDFLCGEFHWKKLWHLDPEPLYKYVSPDQVCEEGEENSLTNRAPAYLPGSEIFV